MRNFSKNTLSGRPLLVAKFLETVENSDNYKAIKRGKDICIYRDFSSSSKKKPTGSPLFTIREGARLSETSQAKFNRGKRKKIAFFMRDLVPELVQKF